MISIILFFLAYMIATISDVKTKTIPNLTYLILCGVSFLNMFYYGFSKRNLLLSFFILGLVFLILGVKTDGIGGGDIKLIAFTGLALGFTPTVFITGIAFILAMLKMKLDKKKTKEKSEVPLAPYMLISVLTLFILLLIFSISQFKGV